MTVPGQVAAAYTNSFPGATSTTLYDLQYATGGFFLNMQTPANDGTILAVGATGIMSPSTLVGFDISGSTGLAYVASNATSSIAGNIFSLSTINLMTGNISSVSPVIGSAINFQVRGLTTAAVAVPEPASLLMLGVGVAGVGLMARRRQTQGR